MLLKMTLFQMSGPFMFKEIKRFQFTKAEFSEYKQTINTISKKAKEGIEKCRNILKGNGVSYEANEEQIEGWEDIKKEVSETLDNIDLESVYRENTENLKFEKVIEFFIKNKEENVQTLLKNQIKSIKEEIRILDEKEEEIIKKDIEQNVIINMTKENIESETIEETLKTGANYIPKVKRNKRELRKMIRQGLAEHLNQSYGERHFKHKIFQGKNLEQDIITHLGNPNLLDEDCDYLMNLLEGMEETVQNNWEDYKPDQNSKETDFYTNIFDLDGKVIIKSDKNIGYGLYSLEQVLELYQKTNEENGYVKVNITNEEYLKNISKLKTELLPEIPEWIDLKIPLRFKENLKQTEGEIAFMKILPKVHKLQTPSFETFGSLTCRTIKAGNNDPLNAISAVIGKVTKHLVKMVKIYLIRKYGFQPSVEGGDEAFERISSGKWKVEWSRSINAQGDIVNLYPSLDFKYVKIAYEKAFIIVKIDPESCQYIINGLYITMTNNVFRQPVGHFKSGGTTKKHLPMDSQ